MLKRITFFWRRSRLKADPGRDRFAKWNQSARKVLHLAHEEAIKLKHSSIGCAHLLLAVLQLEEGIAYKALQRCGFELDTAFEALKQTIGVGQTPTPLEGLTPGCKQAMLCAVDEARRMRHGFVDSGHILLGILRVREDIATQFLLDRGVDVDRLRGEIWKRLASREVQSQGEAMS